jgi:hypothetical protein
LLCFFLSSASSLPGRGRAAWAYFIMAWRVGFTDTWVCNDSHRLWCAANREGLVFG